MYVNELWCVQFRAESLSRKNPSKERKRVLSEEREREREKKKKKKKKTNESKFFEKKGV